MGSRIRLTVCVVFVALASVSNWLYVNRILKPRQVAESKAHDIPRGNLSDLYPRWLGSRELLLHHRDPYSDAITREIQAGYYGRALDPERPNDPKDQQAFAYPVYVAVLLAPTVETPFWIVQKVFFWLLMAATAGSVLLWLNALGWRVSCAALAIWLLLTLSCLPAIQGIKLQQLSLLVAALIAGAMSALARRHYVLAGMLLALATIKPQLAALPILWLCIWVTGDWRTRRHAFWSLLVSAALLVAAGELLLPGWIHEFRAALAAYYHYTGGGKSVLDVALTPLWGRLVSAILVGMLMVRSWQLRSADERSAAFQWSFALSLAVTLVVIPMFAPYNQLLLLPAIMIIARSFRRLWTKNLGSRFLVGITALAVFFQWIAAAALVVALVFMGRSTGRDVWELPFYPSLAIPIVVLALFLLAYRVPSDEAAGV